MDDLGNIIRVVEEPVIESWQGEEAALRWITINLDGDYIIDTYKGNSKLSTSGDFMVAYHKEHVKPLYFNCLKCGGVWTGELVMIEEPFKHIRCPVCDQAVFQA